MSDQNTSLADLKSLVDDFVMEREWRQFHTPKNVSMAIAVEAAELMELFQWQDAEESVSRIEEGTLASHATEELADILIFCLSFANATGVDVSDAVRNKLQKNKVKYPVDEYRGRY